MGTNANIIPNWYTKTIAGTITTPIATNAITDLQTSPSPIAITSQNSLNMDILGTYYTGVSSVYSSSMNVASAGCFIVAAKAYIADTVTMYLRVVPNGQNITVYVTSSTQSDTYGTWTPYTPYATNSGQLYEYAIPITPPAYYTFMIYGVISGSGQVLAHVMSNPTMSTGGLVQPSNPFPTLYTSSTLSTTSNTTTTVTNTFVSASNLPGVNSIGVVGINTSSVPDPNIQFKVQGNELITGDIYSTGRFQSYTFAPKQINLGMNDSSGTTSNVSDFNQHNCGIVLPETVSTAHVKGMVWQRARTANVDGWTSNNDSPGFVDSSRWVVSGGDLLLERPFVENGTNIVRGVAFRVIEGGGLSINEYYYYPSNPTAVVETKLQRITNQPIPF